MADIKFIPNPQAAKQLGRQPEMAAAMKIRGEATARNARQIAPVGEGVGGHYRDSIEVEIELVDGVFVSRVVAKKFTARFIEFGTIDTPTFAPLRRGLEMTGL